MDWDDFKFFLAVVRHGSIRAAAKDLEVHPSTVTRRIEHFERYLGVKLFKRRGQTLVLTSAGTVAVGDLQRVEHELTGIEHVLKQSEGGVAGWVRVAVPDFLLLGGLIDDLGGFLDPYPDLWVEWTTLAHIQHPTDVTLLAAADPPLDLIARQVGTVGWSLYGESSLMECLPSAVVRGWVEAVSLGRERSLLSAVATLKQQHLPEIPTVARCQSLAGALSLTRAGVGVAALPCLIGDRDQRLRRLQGATVERQPLWLLLAPENRRTRRVRAFADYLLEAVEARAEQIGGRDSPG